MESSFVWAGECASRFDSFHHGGWIIPNVHVEPRPKAVRKGHPLPTMYWSSPEASNLALHSARKQKRLHTPGRMGATPFVLECEVPIKVSGATGEPAERPQKPARGRQIEMYTQVAYT